MLYCTVSDNRYILVLLTITLITKSVNYTRLFFDVMYIYIHVHQCLHKNEISNLSIRDLSDKDISLIRTPYIRKVYKTTSKVRTPL